MAKLRSYEANSLLYGCVGGELLAVVIQSRALLMESSTNKFMGEWGAFTSLEQQICYVAGRWAFYYFYKVFLINQRTFYWCTSTNDLSMLKDGVTLQRDRQVQGDRQNMTWPG